MIGVEVTAKSSPDETVAALAQSANYQVQPVRLPAGMRVASSAPSTELALCTVDALRAGVNLAGSMVDSSNALVAAVEGPEWVSGVRLRRGMTLKVYGVRVECTERPDDADVVHMAFGPIGRDPNRPTVCCLPCVREDEVHPKWLSS